MSQVIGFDLGGAADADLLVCADYLEDFGNPDVPPLIRRMVDDLRAFDAVIANLRDVGHVRPGVVRLFVREDVAVCKLVASQFVPLGGYSGRRGTRRLTIADGSDERLAEAYSRSAPAPACGRLANGGSKIHAFVADVVRRRYGFARADAIDEAGSFEVSDDNE